MKDILENVGALTIAVVVVLLIVLALSFPVMWLWNYCAPIYWGSAPILNWWQTICSLALLHIIGSCFKTTVKK